MNDGPSPVVPWSLSRRLAFRLAFSFWLLCCLPVTEGLTDVPEWAERYLYTGWHRLVPWAAAHVLHLQTPARPLITGSGDTPYHFVKLLLCAVLAVLAAAGWTLLDARTRRAQAHPRLEAGLRVYLRYVLALSMLSYGFAKVFPSQFPPPPVSRLMQPYGESSPMGLLWTFMGASTAYTIFAGACELLGGVLLLFRRTTTLGALLLVGVMGNVAMMNLCYDVPVKLGSSLLLGMAIFLVLPDLQRLADLLLFHRQPGPGLPLQPHLPAPWMRRPYLVGKGLLVAGLLIFHARNGWQGYKSFGAMSSGSLEGGYEVERMIRSGRELPPLLTDAQRFRSVVIFGAEHLRIYKMDNDRQAYSMKHDQARATLTLSSIADAQKSEGILTYTWIDAAHLRMQGTLQGEPLELLLRKVDRRRFLLVNRGFHWVQEYPFNR